jgi:hypothetical protein
MMCCSCTLCCLWGRQLLSVYDFGVGQLALLAVGNNTHALCALSSVLLAVTQG